VPVLPEQINALHMQAKAFLNDQLQQGDILMLHHAPSWASVPEQYIGDPLNDAYVGNIESIILQKKPKLVLHGHIHTYSEFPFRFSSGRGNSLHSSLWPEKNSFHLGSNRR